MRYQPVTSWTVIEHPKKTMAESIEGADKLVQKLPTKKKDVTVTEFRQELGLK